MEPNNPETKIDATVQLVYAPQADRRTGVRRILKFSLVFSLLVSIGLTAYAWYQSSRLQYYCGMKFGNHDLILSTNEQQIYFGLFREVIDKSGLSALPGSYRIPLNSYLSGNMSIRVEEKLTPRPSRFGFGVINKIDRSARLVNWPFSNPPPESFQNFKGGGVVMPYWFAMLILGSILMFVLMGRRFSLRAFLIWVTIVCVTLGIAVAAQESRAKTSDYSHAN